MTAIASAPTVTGVGVPATPWVRALLGSLRRKGFAPLTAEQTVEEATVVLVGVDGAADRSLIAQLAHSREGLAVVAVVTGDDPHEAVACLVDGARGVIQPSMGPDEAAEVINQAWLGMTCLSSGTLQATLDAVRSEPKDPELDAEQLEVLRALADGVAVADLAARTHRSRRTMTRVLRRLYDCLGVGNRRQAVDWARRQQLI